MTQFLRLTYCLFGLVFMLGLKRVLLVLPVQNLQIFLMSILGLEPPSSSQGGGSIYVGINIPFEQPAEQGTN